MADFVNQEYKHPLYTGPHFMCCYCQTMFISEQFLDKHQKKCIHMKLHLILKMKLQLRRNSGDSGHSPKNTTSDDYFCDECFWGFLKLSDYESHMHDYHPRERPFQCDQYDRNYTDKIKLKLHNSELSEQGQGGGSSEILVKPKGRKRVKNELTWKRNIRKDKRLKGKEYINIKGNVVPQKQPKTGPCRCNNKCHTKITHERQIQIFNEFYNLESFNMQTSFLFTMVKVCNKLRTYTQNPNSKRQKTRLYRLLNSNGKEVKVCKEFFQNTLKVSSGRIDRVLKVKGPTIYPCQ